MENDNLVKTEYGMILKQSISEEMKVAYQDYAMSVIVGRALPDVRDGLKPSQRRILVAMNDLGLSPRSGYRKCAKIAGDTSGNYHPHGESIVYPTLVNMAQPWGMRYPLVDGQGNFGSIDGDSPAAMRYTEARLTKYAEEMLRDIKKATVDFVDNFDATRQEPVYLPAGIPNLLVNGSDGIAVGMATKIPPHNLREIIDALVAIIDSAETIEDEEELAKEVPYLTRAFVEQLRDNPVFDLEEARKLIHAFNVQSTLTVEDLIDIIPGPDFPTGGNIYDQKDILQAYATGKGRILMRAKAEIKELKNNRYQIIVTELPYQQNKALLVAQIAKLHKDGKIDDIADLRDESDRDGLRIVIELKTTANPQKTLNQLYKYSAMQKTFHANMVALVNGEPRLLPLKSMLLEYLEHRKVVIVRRVSFELLEAKHRAHILEGLKIALDNLDEIIELIRKSKDTDSARTELMERFKLSELQAQAILDMQLKRLSALERQKILDELAEIMEQIEHLVGIISSPENVLNSLRQEFIELKENFGDDRRTKIHKNAPGEFSEEDLIKNEQTVVLLSENGYIKRVSPMSFRKQGRGGKGVKSSNLKEEDVIQEVITASTLDTMLYFTNTGRVFSTRVFEIPETSRTARGTAIVNLLQTESEENVTSIVKIRHDAKDYKYLAFGTKNGFIKKTLLEEYDNIRKSGLIAINLKDKDELLSVRPIFEGADIIMVTQNGKAIRFAEEDVRDTGRATSGVIGIRAKKDDETIQMDVLPANDETSPVLLTMSEKGFGKVTNLEEYAQQGRGGQGVFTAKLTEKTGKLRIAQVLNPEIVKDLLVISGQGQIIRLDFDSVPRQSRHTQGVHIIRMDDNDTVASIATIEEQIEESEEE
ncbi:DNA gyrase subunit A [candidate division WWE3 bacterium]|uniref:DNA gyrase subunit A n=1 Tax=candidate division WWE3 bacterium TaxID=2053526 RepID=A0A955LVD2_UNCKA|nr:DNA gyrase subunit A [candidate division WWE3 bacterium]